MPLASEFNLDEIPLQILLIGPSGVGKSIMASDFYKIGPVHYLEFDGKIASVINYHRNNSEALKNISWENYPSPRWKEFMKTFEGFQDPPGPMYRGRKIKTLVLDSVTSCSNTSIVYQLMAKDKIKTTKAGLPATSWDEINGETVWFTIMLEISSNLASMYGTNIIWIAHPVAKMMIGENEGESRRYESIAAYGNKIPGLIPAKFNEVYRVKLAKYGTSYKRVAVTNLAKHDDVVARTAMTLPEEMDVSDGLYTALMRHLRKDIKEEVKPEVEPEVNKEKKDA